MKRTLIVAALAALGTTAAFAQSSVTIYGRLNVSAERQKLGDTVNKGLFNDASRIGFKGTEDLGGGLKANFQLEHRFNADTGAATYSAFWGGAGQTEVNLMGPFGAVRLGHFTSEAYYATADFVSLHNHDTGSSSDFLYAYVSRDDDKVSYRTPSLGGFTLEGAVSARDTADALDRSYDVAANYAMGQLQLGAGFSKIGDAKQFAVRALYEFGSFIVGGYVQRDEDAFGFAGKRTNVRLSGAYLLGASEFHLNAGRAGEIGDFSGTKAFQYTVAYNYNLSKRTKLYTYYTRVGGEGAAVYTGFNGEGNGTFSSFAVGMRHNF